jgi:hypothetical protein
MLRCDPLQTFTDRFHILIDSAQDSKKSAEHWIEFLKCFETTGMYGLCLFKDVVNQKLFDFEDLHKREAYSIIKS